MFKKTLYAAAVVGLMFSAISNAAPCQPPMRGMHNAEAMAQSHMQAAERMLSISEKQKAQWDVYASAKTAKARSMDEFRATMAKSPAVDQQQRLESRARFFQIQADGLTAVAKARAELLKVLEPQQKWVLEQMEGRGHGFGFGPGPKGHPGMVGGKHPCGQPGPQCGMRPGKPMHHGKPMHPPFHGKPMPKPAAPEVAAATK